MENRLQLSPSVRVATLPGHEVTMNGAFSGLTLPQRRRRAVPGGLVTGLAQGGRDCMKDWTVDGGGKEPSFRQTLEMNRLFSLSLV